jgi:pyruvate dehydrogenase E2 component (dihydrolipoamide acetyltransferase)
VKPGDVVAVVETHKGAVDVECFLDGVIVDLVPLGEDLPVGAVLARVRGVGEAAAPAPAAPAPAATPKAAPPLAAAFERALVNASGAPPRIKVSPAACRRTQKLGLDAQRLQGSGADGALTLADI